MRTAPLIDDLIAVKLHILFQQSAADQNCTTAMITACYLVSCSPTFSDTMTTYRFMSRSRTTTKIGLGHRRIM